MRDFGQFQEINAHFGRALAQVVDTYDMCAVLRALERQGKQLQGLLSTNLVTLMERTEPLLLKRKTVELPYVRHSINVLRFFSPRRKDLYIEYSTTKIISVAVRILSISEYTRTYDKLYSFELRRDTTLQELRSLLDVRYTHPRDISLLLKKQASYRQPGALVGTVRNIFFVPGGAVSVRMFDEQRPWGVSFSFEHEIPLSKGNIIFTPTPY